MSYSSGTEFHLITQEPVICNGHLSYPWGQHWREGRVASETRGMGGGGVSKAKCLGVGKVRTHSKVGA